MEPAPLRPAQHSVEGYLPAIESLLRQIIRRGGFEITFTVRKGEPDAGGAEAPDVVIDFSGADEDLLLAKNGSLLDALEYVALRGVRLEEDLFGKVIFDCADWRRVRVEELKLMARVAAESVIESGVPFPLKPMNARERRIVHLALKDQPKVRTASEGFGAERKVVIHPA